jgi:hypothetical protein
VLIRVHSWFTSQRNLRNQRQRTHLFMQNKPNFRPFFYPSYALISCAFKPLCKKLQFCNFPKTNPIQTQSNPILRPYLPLREFTSRKKSPQLYVGGYPESSIKNRESSIELQASSIEYYNSSKIKSVDTQQEIHLTRKLLHISVVFGQFDLIVR